LKCGWIRMDMDEDTANGEREREMALEEEVTAYFEVVGVKAECPVAVLHSLLELAKELQGCCPVAEELRADSGSLMEEEEEEG
jgi:hypothetical protein